MSGPIFVVQLSVAADREAEWNDWYNTVHIPEVMASSPDIISATRYRLFDGDIAHRYLAIYQFGSQEGLQAFMSSERLAAMGAEYTQDWGGASTRQRGAFTPLLEVTSTHNREELQ